MQNDISFMPRRKSGSGIKLTQDQLKTIALSSEQQAKFGIGLDENAVQDMVAMDASLTPTLTNSMAGTPSQFLQSFLPGIVEVVTQERKSDLLMGTLVSGSWEDEEVVQQVLELVGNAKPYGDNSNLTLASWNSNFEKRTIVRLELGLEVTKLEEARATRMGVNSSEYKRKAVANALEISRNRIAFHGYNDGVNRTYGMLNDPSLLPVINVPNGVSGFSDFERLTLAERRSALLLGFKTLRTQSGDRIDTKTSRIVLGVPTSIVDLFSDGNKLEGTLTDWLTINYPNVEVVSAPEFDGANGGDNVIYMYADTVLDSGTDGNQTLVQIVPTKFQLTGVETGAKGNRENYTSATAGVLVKRPYAIVRLSGV